METDKLFEGKCFNRDLSWLLFNRRVIDLANENTTPFNNKLMFLAIAANNLDEFYSIRVPSLQSQEELTHDGEEHKSGEHYSKILKQLHKRNEKNFEIQYSSYSQLDSQLVGNGFCNLTTYKALNASQMAKANQIFDQRILPFLSFTTYDDNYNLDFLKNKRMALGVSLKINGKHKIRIVPIPTDIDRLVKIKGANIDTYIMIEDLIRNNLSNLFDDGEIDNIITFRIIRDLDASLDVEKDDDNDDTINNLRHYLADREKGRITMFEVENKSQLDTDFVKSFMKKFKINKHNLYKVNGPVDLTFLFKIVKLLSKEYPNLSYPKFEPAQWNDDHSMLNYLNHHDMLLQYPYDSFNQYLEFLDEAINNPNTVAIKQTIYRVAHNSKVIELLKKAAQKGIKVTVMVELRARFDEANNLKVTTELEDAGCNIVFGKKFMKVHSKTCLVLTEAGMDPKGYVQIGTGNYNESTASQFVDLSLFSSKASYVKDLAAFFNYLEQPIVDPPKYEVLTASPHRIEDMVIQNIEQVKKYYLETGKGHVFLKVNSLTDVDVISAIYDAATVGVPFRLIVRGACCLELGVCGPKENIVISSIFGELLEHSRIYAFYDETESVWISSADLMTRNMDNRVELAAPIHDPDLMAQIQSIISTYANDDVDGCFMNLAGDYFKYENPKGASAQQTFIKEIGKYSPKFDNSWIDRLNNKVRKILKFS
ncbi:polyphosphate kinase 1 [Fructilactobacillus sp. Tb1]|uniref:polyphosphate kinase 1 n=1 Tax=Fructilactobacillus sp. Tb1 TaxID=3422304 RepID=UPI003D2D75A3